jgi:hypothetical protein
MARGVSNWGLFPEDIRPLLQPCLASNYQLGEETSGAKARDDAKGETWPRFCMLSLTLNQLTVHPRDHLCCSSLGGSSEPFFKPQASLRKWLYDWIRHLAMRAKGTRATVLRACRVVIRNDIPISVFLLPYAVENVLRTGSEEDMEQIRLAMLVAVHSIEAAWFQ